MTNPVSLVSIVLLLPALAFAGTAPRALIPITTSSSEARALYLEGRALIDRLKATDANAKMRAAVNKDPDFALAWLQLSATSGTPKMSFVALRRATALAGKASEGEQLLIRAADAGARSLAAEQETLLRTLVRKYPVYAFVRADARLQLSRS